DMGVGDILKREVIFGRDPPLRRARRNDKQQRAANRLESHETQYIAPSLTPACGRPSYIAMTRHELLRYGWQRLVPCDTERASFGGQAESTSHDSFASQRPY